MNWVAIAVTIIAAVAVPLIVNAAPKVWPEQYPRYFMWVASGIVGLAVAIGLVALVDVVVVKVRSTFPTCKPFSLGLVSSAEPWSKGRKETVGWFAYVSRYRAVVPINAAFYVELTVRSDPIKINDFEAVAHTGGQWIPLTTLKSSDHGQYQYFYMTDAQQLGLGYELPATLDLAAQALGPFPPAIPKGWLFFAYPASITGPVDRYRLTATDDENCTQSIDVVPGGPTIDNLHAPLLPDTTKPATNIPEELHERPEDLNVEFGDQLSGRAL